MLARPNETLMFHRNSVWPANAFIVFIVSPPLSNAESAPEQAIQLERRLLSDSTQAQGYE